MQPQPKTVLVRGKDVNQFKVGDKVTPVNVYREDYAGPMERLMGKTMVVVSTSKDRDGNEIVCADVPGEMDRWSWYAQDLRLVPENQSELTDPSPTRTDFKVGDYVVPVRVDNEGYTEDRSFMQDKVLRVVAVVSYDSDFSVRAGLFLHEAGAMWWNKDDLRLATADEIAATVDPVEFKDGDKVVLIESSKVATIRNRDSGFKYPLEVNGKRVSKYGVDLYSEQVIIRHATADEIAASKKPKSLRVGDLVEYKGEVWIVLGGEDLYGECEILSLTGGFLHDHTSPSKLTKVGSIIKKANRLKREIEK